MSTHSSSAPERRATPHATTTNQTLSDAVRRRAQSLIKDTTIDAGDRSFIRYALATNDGSGLSELVQRVDAGEPLIDESCLLEVNEELSTEEKVERLAEMICQAGTELETRSAALLVLMSTLENSTEPKLLANHLKHLAFTRCGELNCYRRRRFMRFRVKASGASLLDLDAPFFVCALDLWAEQGRDEPAIFQTAGPQGQ